MSHDENRPTADFDDERLNVLVTCEMEDGEHFQVPVGLLQQSKTFLNMYNDLGLSVSGLGDDFVFNLPMRGTIFRAIIKWCEEHKGGPFLMLRIYNFYWNISRNSVEMGNEGLV